MVWNPESRIQKVGIRNPKGWNPESRCWDPESRTFVDSLTWGDRLLHFRLFLEINAITNEIPGSGRFDIEILFCEISIFRLFSAAATNP